MTRIPVCIFAKPPIAGRVKTRLARTIGQIEAAQLAAAMLCDVWSAVQDAAGVFPVLAAAEPGTFPVEVSSNEIWLQQPGDLGSRIEGILRRGLELGQAAVALGADSPLLTAAHVAEAIECLNKEDTVIGPCNDGGFYLLGVHDCPPGLLAYIPWSSEETSQKTEHRLRAHGMTVGTIRSSFDVDSLMELEQLRRELEHLPPDIAPQTRQWFERTSWSAS